MVQPNSDDSRLAKLEQRVLSLERRLDFARYVKERGFTSPEIVIEWLKTNKTVRAATLAQETNFAYSGAAFRQAIFRMACKGCLIRTRTLGLYVVNPRVPLPKPYKQPVLDEAAVRHDWERGASLNALARKYNCHKGTIKRRLFGDGD